MYQHILATSSLLDELGRKYGTEKSSEGHNFTEIYSGYFDRLRLEVRKVVEFGIDSGASIRMWAEYFPNAVIHGVDIDPKTLLPESERICCHLVDQGDLKCMEQLRDQIGLDIDIVIDDGGHTMSQQLTTFAVFFPALRQRGIYVVEDLHTSYWDEFGGGYKKEGTMIELLKDMVDRVNLYGKSRFADPIKAIDEIARSNPHPLTFIEKNLLSMHFYKSIAVLFRS